MNGRLLPGKEQIEEFVRDRIVDELNACGRDVVEAMRGDTDEVPFDWLLRLDDGTHVGLEVVRAEDQGQVHHVERESRAGETVITGTAEMPWDSLRRAVEKKVANVDRYRGALGRQGELVELHLGVTSALQELTFEGDLAEHMANLARGALGPFDVVWLIQGDFVERFI